jgi:hypothetical protein
MRTLLMASFPVETANEAIKNGALQQTVQSLMETLKPEAAYFFPDAHGRRSALFVFDMEGSWQLPATLEPLFQNVGAAVHVTPAMNAEDLQRGMKEAGITG